MESNKDEIEFKEEFTNPSAKYRGFPFWAWNSKLNTKELLRQIDCFKQMGFGGFYMHSRAGMATKYLGSEFMKNVSACVNHSKKLNMYACLYDEDRWPSGFAGGYVAKEKDFRQKQICLSLKAPLEFLNAYNKNERDPEFLCAYDITFTENDRILNYHIINENEQAKGEKWYAYKIYNPCCGYHNGYTYSDTLNPNAVNKFIEVTHEKYKEVLKDDFGKTVSSIFTDEPSFGRIFLKAFARDGKDLFFPWTELFPLLYLKEYNDDILNHLPELVWDLNNNQISATRYRFYRLLSELFSKTFCDRIGKWCMENKIALVGHTLDEDSLLMQMCAVGESMRTYKEFKVPGIDMLCNDVHFTTIKQAQSVAHQYKKEGVLSELYGVTGWDFDFRGHKSQGDWQAALGVNKRVLHLSWFSMQGAAKRDYPASINYQSSWYNEYSYIENHFARLNVSLAKGEPLVNVVVLHPIESAWLIAGVLEHTSEKINALEENFNNITEWLLRGQIDFDYISESLLTELYHFDEKYFSLGNMKYKAVVIPPLFTIRKTTLDALKKFVDNNGKVIVCSSYPKYVDGISSNEAKSLWEKVQKIDFNEGSVLEVLKEEREIIIYGNDGKRKKDLIYTMRKCGKYNWLFLAHCDMVDNLNGNDCKKEEYVIKIKGTYSIKLYDTINGDIKEIDCTYKNNETIIKLIGYPFDSFLLQLTPTKENKNIMIKENYVEEKVEQLNIPDFVNYKLSEKNVFVLDMAKWSLDGKHYNSRDEIIHIDKIIREELKYPLANGTDMQPWCLKKNQKAIPVYLRFIIKSEIEIKCLLGYEFIQAVYLNGKKVEVKKRGYYVDKAIHTMPLPKLIKGDNELIIVALISKRISLENFFLIGNFGVSVLGSKAIITKLPKKIAFGSIVNQGLPFYGATITYKIPFSCNCGDLVVTTNKYFGVLISVKIDNEEKGKIVLPPYELKIKNIQAGKHLLELKLYISRQNTFGALHLAAPLHWKGPNMWYCKDNLYSIEYCFSQPGIMKKPKIEIIYKNK